MCWCLIDSWLNSRRHNTFKFKLGVANDSESAGPAVAMNGSSLCTIRLRGKTCLNHNISCHPNKNCTNRWACNTVTCFLVLRLLLYPDNSLTRFDGSEALVNFYTTGEMPDIIGALCPTRCLGSNNTKKLLRICCRHLDLTGLSNSCN